MTLIDEAHGDAPVEFPDSALCGGIGGVTVGLGRA